MATPIIESIRDSILTRLALITTGNGYEFTVTTAEYVNRDTDEFPTEEPPFIIVNLELLERNDDLSCPGNPPAIAHDATFRITGYASKLDVDANEPGVTDTGVSDMQMHAAIQKAICTPLTGAWDQWEGNAIMSELTKTTTEDMEGHDGAALELTVTYRTPENNPFTTR